MADLTPPLAKQPGLPIWTLPARLLDRVRPGLTDWAARDVAWLARFPAVIRSIVIPATVVAIPFVFAAARAFDLTRPGPQLFAFRIIDVYTESIPFMVIAAAIGMAAPSLGVLFLASEVVADLVAAFIQPAELKPLPAAILARFLSYWLLYLLVAELPIAAHEIAATVRRRLRRGGTLASILFGSGAATILAWIWGNGAPLLIRPVFTWTALGRPSANAGWPLLVASDEFAYIVGAVTLGLFVVRFLVLPDRAEPIVVRVSRPQPALLRLAFTVAVPILLFLSVVTKPIDAAVLIGAVVLAGPISVLVLRGARLGRPLAAIPRTVRLLAGFAVSAAAGFGIATVLGVSTISDWFTMNVVMAVGFVLMRVLLDADDFAQVARPGPPVAAGVAATFVAIGVVWLFAASWAFADDTRQQSDGYGNAAAAAAAGAAAGALAAASAGRGKPPKLPPEPQVTLTMGIPTIVPEPHVELTMGTPTIVPDGPPPPPPPYERSPDDDLDELQVQR